MEAIKDKHIRDSISAYSKYTFSMFGGEIAPVTMVFHNRMMGAVMDRFGRDVVVMKEDDRHFRITVPIAVSNQFYGWVFGLGKMVRIVAPESMKEGMKKSPCGYHRKVRRTIKKALLFCIFQTKTPVNTCYTSINRKRRETYW